MPGLVHIVDMWLILDCFEHHWSLLCNLANSHVAGHLLVCTTDFKFYSDFCYLLTVCSLQLVKLHAVQTSVDLDALQSPCFEVWTWLWIAGSRCHLALVAMMLLFNAWCISVWCRGSHSKSGLTRSFFLLTVNRYVFCVNIIVICSSIFLIVKCFF